MSDPTQAALEDTLRDLKGAVEYVAWTAEGDRSDAETRIAAALTYVISGYGEQAAALLAPAIYEGAQNAIMQSHMG